MPTTTVVVEFAAAVGFLALHKVFSKHRRRWSEPCFEIGLIVLLYAVYDMSAGVAHAAESVAKRNALYIIDLEERMGLAFELGMQRWLLANALRIVAFLNVWYLGMHWIGCIAFFLWLYARRGNSPTKHRQWKQYRTCFMVMNYLAFLCYFIFPVMPPRLVPEKGYIDTIGHVHGVSPYKENQAKINPYGAMPSMHFGWAFLFAFAMNHMDILKRMRFAPYLYPTVMLLSIIVTGNHYFLDAVGGLVCAALAIFFINSPLMRAWCPDCEPPLPLDELENEKRRMYDV